MNEKRLSLLPLLFNIDLENCQCSKVKGKKKHAYWKGTSNSVFIQEYSVKFIENCRNILRILELINGFNKVRGYQINILKSIVFVDASN